MLFEDELKKIFLAGVGAIATTVESGQKIINNLVEKGEITVNQGKVLNQELKRNWKKTFENSKKAIKKDSLDFLDKIDTLSHEQLEKLKEKISKLESKDGQK